MNVLIIGSSGGIGKALAQQVQRRWPDANLICASRSGDEGSHLIDLTREDSVAAAAASVAGQVDQLHWLINATGTLHGDSWQPEKQLKDLNQNAMTALLNINTVGPMLLARYFVPLLTHNAASVFATLAARVGSISDNRKGGWYSYRMSKAALIMGIRTLAIESARRAPNLACVALHPGTVATDLSAPFQRHVPDAQLFTPERSANHLLDVIQTLTPEQSGKHIAWDGKEIPE
ncbi:MAG: SDR family NAD(P)-dependent oxidoreductase [Lysobacterales bacterium]